VFLREKREFACQEPRTDQNRQKLEALPAPCSVLSAFVTRRRRGRGDDDEQAQPQGIPRDLGGGLGGRGDGAPSRRRRTWWW
jgi:hypothetical protein